MSNIEPTPTEQQAARQIFERAYIDALWAGLRNACGPREPDPQLLAKLNWPPKNLDHEFIVDESHLRSMVHNPEIAPKLAPEQALAALEYWRVHAIAAVEEVAARYRAEISARLSEPAEGGRS